MTIVTYGVNALLGYPGTMPVPNQRDVISSNVVRILRDARISKAMSMTDLAARAGLSRSMISLVERELRNPTLDTLLRVSEVLQTPLSEVLLAAEKIVPVVRKK